ncbi:MAG: hypothetical protein J6B77_09905, partial [Clostridia bacterium]|nr:hypothetical protein [Clostridia bacterium]
MHVVLRVPELLQSDQICISLILCPSSFIRFLADLNEPSLPLDRRLVISCNTLTAAVHRNKLLHRLDKSRLRRARDQLHRAFVIGLDVDARQV